MARFTTLPHFTRCQSNWATGRDGKTLLRNSFKGHAIATPARPADRTHCRLAGVCVTTTKGFATSVFSQIAFTAAGPRVKQFLP